MSRMKTMGWEYTTSNTLLAEPWIESELDEMGRDLWELCGIITTQTEYIYYFKRPKDVTDFDSRD